jgi:hypothetical protein
MSRQVFRIFVSSTFGDFQAEREALRAVWDRLEIWCAGHGASFQVVDLRWGIGPDVAFSHDTIQICLNEVKRCQKLSPKPNFLMLIGDRYGWRPPAVTIPDEEFTKIIGVVSTTDADFLRGWYRKDENAVPTEWCLKHREEEHKTYTAWEQIEKRLTAIFQTAHQKSTLPPERYLYSATHQEIFHGLLKYTEAQDHVFSFNRNIEGLLETLHSSCCPDAWPLEPWFAP